MFCPEAFFFQNFALRVAEGIDIYCALRDTLFILKKVGFFIFFFSLSALMCLQAQDNAIRIFIEGTAEDPEHLAYFLDNFDIETVALGVTATRTKEEAAYTFRFRSEKASSGNGWILLMWLFNNETGAEMVSYSWAFQELTEMYTFNQFVLFQSVALIPRPVTIVQVPGATIGEDGELVLPEGMGIDDSWSRKLFYLRLSLDYPVNFYDTRQVEYDTDVNWANGNNKPGDKGAKGRFPQYTMVFPGLTLGFELAPLSFLSLELQARANYGDTTGYFTDNANGFVGLSAAAQLKGILRPSPTFMVQPYMVFSIPLVFSPEFTDGDEKTQPGNEFKPPDSLPPTLGGGVQVNVRGSDKGAFFLDVGFASMLDTFYLANHESTFPQNIPYTHFSFSIGVGYKFGLGK